MFVAQHSDRFPVPPDWNIQHRIDSERREIAFRELTRVGMVMRIRRSNHPVPLQRGKVPREIARAQMNLLSLMASPDLEKNIAIYPRSILVENPHAGACDAQRPGGNLRDPFESGIQCRMIELCQLHQRAVKSASAQNPSRKLGAFKIMSGNLICFQAGES